MKNGQTCIGVKLINATAMTRRAYNDYRGWDVPNDENGDDPGYLVEYFDGGRRNHPDHTGYISWSPADVFEKAYRPVTGMSFGLAIEAMKQGRRVCRAGWNGKSMWLALVPDHAATKSADMLYHPVNALPWIGLKTLMDDFEPWTATQTDMLADDWQIIEGRAA